MIYVVTKQQDIIGFESCSHLSVEQSLATLREWKMIQFDTEGTGLDCHIAKMLSMQFGHIDKSIQIVVDVTTIDPLLYKEILETKFIIGQNLKYDIKMLMSVGICIRHVYDTMSAECLMYLGFPRLPVNPKSYIEEGYDFPYHVKYNQKGGRYYELSFALDAIAKKYLDIDIDKSIRGNIKNEGLSERVIEYAANDVVWLYDIMRKQVAYFKKVDAMKALEIECNFVPVLAYFEYCGVKLDADKWMELYNQNCAALQETIQKLNAYVEKLEDQKFLHAGVQLDLFDSSPSSFCSINWSSSDDVIPLLQKLGFNTKGYNKEKKEETESAGADIVKKQKNVCPEFAELYIEYSRLDKLTSTYGPQYVNAINPKTGRLHTEFRALDTFTGRVSCGSQKINEDLAALKGLPLKKVPKHPELTCAYPQIQNLPNKDEVRACFIAEKGNDFVSIDYNSEESRLLASLSEDKGMLEIFDKGYDMHSYVAYLIYPDKIPRDVDIRTIKKDYHSLRQAAKVPEFTFAFLGTWATLVANNGMPVEEAKAIEKYYKEGFAGATAYQEACKKRTEATGIILICKETNHFARWWDWKKWKKRQDSKQFWEDYRKNKEQGLPRTAVAEEHFKARNKYDKNSVNSTTQGLGAVIFKEFTARFLNWILDNGLFDIVKFCVPVHDEICIECPKTMTEQIAEKLKFFMEDTGAKYCHKLPLPAEAEIAPYWKH